MTIDEAITFCNEKAINIKLKAEPKVFIQLAEWLEELKARREADRISDSKPFDVLLVQRYNKAIDDYMIRLCKHCMQQKNECNKKECPFSTGNCGIVSIGEKLKEGD